MSDTAPPLDRRTTRPEKPTPGEIAEALENIVSVEPPSTPAVRDLRVLDRAGLRPPIHVDGATINEWGITRGDPQHGALRSDDHVSDWKIHFQRECPECGFEYAVFEYGAYHHISGAYSIECARSGCSHVHDAEQWA